MALTPSQAAAVECDDNLIIFAGPGSGKTSTSIAKAERILMDESRTLIMCTFTVEAADVLGERLHKRFTAAGAVFPKNRVRVATFDSLALWHLKAQGAMKHKLLSPKAQGPKLRQLIYEHGLGTADEILPWFESYQATLERADLVQRMKTQMEPAYQLVQLYYDWLKASGMVDLATVKRTCATGIANGSLALFPCTDLLVDEAQDCDELQMLMARSHGRGGVCTTLVGDDDQTIYDWRAATGYKGMQRFVEECGAQVARLSENFRSHSEIVDAATQLIAFNNPDRVDKQQVAVRGPGGSSSVGSFGSLAEECEWVAEDILERLAPPYDCAVIARRNRSLDVVEVALTAAGIPHHRPGTSLWDRDDIASYLALLRYLVEGALDGLSLALGFMGVPNATINELLYALREDPGGLFKGDLPMLESANPEVLRVLKQVAAQCARWRGRLAAGQVLVLIGESASEYPKWLLALEGKEESKKLKRLREGLEYVTAALEKLQGKLSARLRVLLEQKRKEPAPGMVRVMTMHASKGLEFDAVYLVDCSEREDDTTLTMAAAERRVLYVGMTRARKDLRITYGGGLPQFLKEAGFKVQ
jgi:DNA helicase II / ATP-dependent DNA helicase PcrA